jgi:hypothetical protein
MMVRDQVETLVDILRRRYAKLLAETLVESFATPCYAH